MMEPGELIAELRSWPRVGSGEIGELMNKAADALEAALLRISELEGDLARYIEAYRIASDISQDNADRAEELATRLAVLSPLGG